MLLKNAKIKDCYCLSYDWGPISNPMLIRFCAEYSYFICGCTDTRNVFAAY
ncbi:hypothetical protein J14TS2_48160 [Bacillus sp. J14TS2]|nr:hypothetical protein J14TS2_48160 [Bacillus sp. J14TS2]